MGDKTITEATVPCNVEDCDELFKLPYDMYRHMYSFHKYPVRCPYKYCDGFYRPQQLEHHIKDVHMMIRFRCLRCGALLKRNNLSKHTQLCLGGGERKYVCEEPNCEAKFRTAFNLRTHYKSVHTQPIKCPIEGCEKWFKPRGLPNHIQNVHDRRPGVCEKCGKVMTHRSLIRHRKLCNNDGTMKFVCTVEGCSQEFNTTQKRTNHLYYHHKEPVRCPRPGCNLVLKQARLGTHIREVHDGERGECDICKKTMLKSVLPHHVIKCVVRRPRKIKDPPQATVAATIEKSQTPKRSKAKKVGECDNCKTVMSMTDLRRHAIKCTKRIEESLNQGPSVLLEMNNVMNEILPQLGSPKVARSSLSRIEDREVKIEEEEEGEEAEQEEEEDEGDERSNIKENRVAPVKKRGRKKKSMVKEDTKKKIDETVRKSGRKIKRKRLFDA